MNMVYLILYNSPKQTIRFKCAPVVGLAAQIPWAYLGIIYDLFIIQAVSVVYLFIFLNGIYVRWIKEE